MLKRFANVLGWVVVFFLFCFGVYGGWQMTKTLWPGLHDDGTLYSTVVINKAAGYGNTFAVYTRSLLKDRGGREFDGHGQLYYPIAAFMIKNANYQSFLSLLHLSNIIAFIASFIVFLYSTNKYLSQNILVSATIGISGAYGLTAVLHYLQGRPEHGIPFILLFFLITRIILNHETLPDWLIGIQIGLIALISPLPGIIAGLGSVFVRATQSGAKNIIRASGQQFLYAVITWWLIMLMIYDKSIFHWFNQTFGGATLNLFQPEGIIAFWGKLSLAPGLGVLLLLIIFLGMKVFFHLIRCKNLTGNKVVATIALIGLAYFIYKHGVAWAATNYCFLGFFPSAVVWSMQSIKNISSLGYNLSRYTMILILIIATALPALGYFRSCLFQSAIIKRGVSFQSALQRINQLKETLDPHEVILIDGYRNARSAVVLDGLPWKMRSNYVGENLEDVDKKLGDNVKYFVSLQFSDPIPKPPQQGTFQLIEDMFNKTPISIGGFVIKKSTPGYSYAIYERQL